MCMPERLPRQVMSPEELRNHAQEAWGRVGKSTWMMTEPETRAKALAAFLEADARGRLVSAAQLGRVMHKNAFGAREMIELWTRRTFSGGGGREIFRAMLENVPDHVLKGK